MPLYCLGNITKYNAVPITIKILGINAQKIHNVGFFQTFIENRHFVLSFVMRLVIIADITGNTVNPFCKIWYAIFSLEACVKYAVTPRKSRHLIPKAGIFWFALYYHLCYCSSCSFSLIYCIFFVIASVSDLQKRYSRTFMTI